MSFSNLPLLAVIAGAVVIAALLFMSQWLKSRTKVINVATSQFWQQAIKQAPARVWWQQFRYWWAWLLALVIALLLWLALSGANLSRPTAQQQHWYFLDASAAMTAAHRFSDAKAQLLNDVAADNDNHRQVWLGDAVASLLLTAEDNQALLAARLAHSQAQLQHNSFSDWLAQQQQRLKQDSAANSTAAAISVYYYGAPLSALEQAQLKQLPSNIQVHWRYLAPALARNVGIVALGQAPAQSGQWGKVDVLFKLYDSEQQPLSSRAVKFSLNGEWFQPANIRALADGEFVIADLDVASRPQTLGLTLAQPDTFSADDSASLTLASLPVIRVQLAATTPQWLQQLLALDNGIALVNEAADVAVCDSQQRCPAAPAQLLLDADTNVAHYVAKTTAVSQSAAAAATWQQALVQQWQQNGWLALAAKRQFMQLRFEQAESNVRQLHLSTHSLATLLDEQSADLPLFMLQAIRWLAGNRQFTPYVSLSAPLPQQYGASDIYPMPLQATTALPSTDETNNVTAANLLSERISRAVTQAPHSAVVTVDDNQWPMSLVSLFILLAAGLLIVEWLMLQRGRLP